MSWLKRLSLSRLIAYGLAGAAFAVSFRHVKEVATGHGQHGWVAWAIAVSVELMALAGFTETKSRQGSGRGIATAVWPVLLGTAMSLAANVATAGPGVWGVVMAAWPSAAFISVAVMVELEPGGKEQLRPQTAEAMDIVRAEMAGFLASFTAHADEVLRRVDERMRTHGDAVLDAVRAHGEEVTAAVRARLDEAVRDLGTRTHEMEGEIEERLNEVEEWSSKANSDLAKQVRGHLEQVAGQGLTIGAQLVQVAKAQGDKLAADLHSQVEQVTEQGRQAAAALVEDNRRHTAGLGAKVAELTTYVELADTADQVRAERAETERRELVEHVADLAKAARARTARTRDESARTEMRARTTMRAVTSGASRTPAVRTASAESGARITPEEFVRELVKVMRADPEWTPDYPALIERTGYKLRWLQMRVTEARAQISADEEIADAELVEEGAA